MKIGSNLLKVWIFTSLLFSAELLLAQKANWYEARLEEMSAILQLPEQEQIPHLGQLVRIGCRMPYDRPLSANATDIFKRAQTALLQIQGHSKYFGDRIWKSYSAYKEYAITGKDPGDSHYGNESGRAFQILSQLPSQETVEVLGDMLSEEWIGPRDSENFGYSSLGTSALQSMSQLPLDHPPTNFAEGAHNNEVELKKNLPAWQNWYAQIKEGRRTFRFEGDPQEYNLRGPAREALNPDIPRATKRPSHQQAATNTSDSRSPSSKAPTITAIVIAILIGGGYWAYRRKVSNSM